MSNERQTEIDALVRRVEDMDRKANVVRRAVNVLCEEASLPVRFPEIMESSGSAKAMQINDATFYGKKLQTALKEFLEMRGKEHPAKPKEILDALKSGGYVFETKNDDVALVSLRATLRKRHLVFHRLPSGAYGLTAWWPELKKSKSDDDGDDDTESKAAATKKAAAATKLRKSRAAPRKGQQRGSTKKPPKGKEKPHVVHEPDVKGPVKAAEVA
jgi:hypothetical protein